MIVGMIEDIAARIHPSLRYKSGKVFYSGRAAFSAAPASVYLLGYNPGGHPVKQAAETVGSHTEFVLSRAPSEWSAYRDELWRLGRQPGRGPLQRRVQHLLTGLGLDPRRVPSSNLIFEGSPRQADLAEADHLANVCWPVHEAVLAMLRPKALVCRGRPTGEHVRNRLGADRHLGSFQEQNNRRWRSHAWATPTGLIVFRLTHPSIADWTNPQTDPTPMVRSWLT
jgi:hypothetical protein